MSDAMDKRTFVQVSGLGTNGVVALASDGTCWTCHLPVPGYPTVWVRLPSLPQVLELENDV